jgi:hypothetical protein
MRVMEEIQEIQGRVREITIIIPSRNLLSRRPGLTAAA